MSPRDKARGHQLALAVAEYQAGSGVLPGLSGPGHLDALVAQFIDSLRRVEFAHHIRDAKHDPTRMDPASDIFDPLRAAVLRNRAGEIDEAWWLVFLGTHFGKHGTDGWRLTRDIYGRLGQGGTWDWPTTSGDPLALQAWLCANAATLKGGDGISRRFSNHRRYESLAESPDRGTARSIASYVAWVGPPRTHVEIILDTHKNVGQNPHAVFAALFESMNAVHRFGRLGRFDFLAMLGKLGIAPIEPGSTFLKAATGPLRGARLLFGGAVGANLSARELEAQLVSFGQETGLGPQVLEDALCNWQKSPAAYIQFKG